MAKAAKIAALKTTARTAADPQERTAARLARAIAHAGELPGVRKSSW